MRGTDRPERSRCRVVRRAARRRRRRSRRRKHAEAPRPQPVRGRGHPRRRLYRRCDPGAVGIAVGRRLAFGGRIAIGGSIAVGRGIGPSASPAARRPASELKVGLVTDVGRINDKGFNQSAYEGMQAAAAAAPTCFDTDYIETTSQSDYAKNIAEFTDAGYDVVIGVGFLLGDALGDAAMANPDIKFISVDGVPSAGHDTSWSTNGETLFFAEDQAGYLAGVLAASIEHARPRRRCRRPGRRAAGRAFR